MLHYNYSTSLTHFLSYHHLEDQTANEKEQTSANSMCEEKEGRCSASVAGNKSFTIAAILGLKGESDSTNSTADLSVVNLSVHSGNADRSLVSACSGRLEFPLRQGSSGVSVTGHYPAGAGYTTNRHAGMGLERFRFILSSSRATAFSFTRRSPKPFSRRKRLTTTGLSILNLPVVPNFTFSYHSTKL